MVVVESLSEVAMFKLINSRRVLAFIGVLVFLLSPLVAAPSQGHLNGLITDESGQPIVDILVALLQEQALQALPILTRTDDRGEIQFHNIEAGNYKMLVKSSKYRGPGEVVRISAGRTSVITLVLQQFLQLSASRERNLSVKTLLRLADRRLIFRGLPQVGGQDPFKRSKPPFENAVFQMYSNAGLDGDYFVFPGDSNRGMTSNFAVVESLGVAGKYILSGQFNSGQDSLWRLKSFLEFPVSNFQSVQLSVGYARMSFDQPSLGLLNNPALLSDAHGFTRALGTTKILTVGLSDRISLGDTFSLLWGLEMNRVEMGQPQTFLNPNVEVSYTPTKQTTVRFVLASKRQSQGNSLALPNGDIVALNDAVYFSRIADNFMVGTSRYYLGSVNQKLDENTEIELASFNNQLSGHMSPFLAVSPGKSEVEVMHLDNDQVDSRGYRVTLRRQLGQHLTASVSYIRGNATGIHHQTAEVLPDQSMLHTLFGRHNYQTISTDIEAYIPFSQTRFKALVKFAPRGHPIPTLDTFSDDFDTGNRGVNLFIRQLLPVPAGFLNFVGLDFLTAYKIEGLLDIRNLTNEDLAKIRTATGDLVLVRNPRTLRGGIAFLF